MKGFLIFALVFIFQCSLVDLRNDELRSGNPSEDSIRMGKEILEQPIDPGLHPSKWADIQGLEIFLIDYWNSGLVRFFTPVPERVQAMQVKISLVENSASLRFTDGRGRGRIIGIDKGEPYIIEPNADKVITRDTEVKLYIESLRRYILLPFTVHSYTNIAMMNEMGLGGKEYKEVFATRGDWEPSEKYDQYRLYIRKDTGSIEFVRFTYRDVFLSYEGILHYDEYTNFENILFPMKIGIQNDFFDEKPTHQLQIGTVKFLKTEPKWEE